MRQNNLTSTISDNLRLFDPMKKRHIDSVVFNVHNSKIHELKKAEIAFNLKKDGFSFLTEGILKNGLRCDVAVLDVSPMIFYEIAVSESDESLIKKRNNYPGKVIVVRV